MAAGDTGSAGGSFPRLHANPGCKSPARLCKASTLPAVPAWGLPGSSGQCPARLSLPYSNVFAFTRSLVAFGVPPATKPPGTHSRSAAHSPGSNCGFLVRECRQLPVPRPGGRCLRRLVAAPGTRPWAAGGREQPAVPGGVTLPTSLPAPAASPRQNAAAARPAWAAGALPARCHLHRNVPSAACTVSPAPQRPRCCLHGATRTATSPVLPAWPRPRCCPHRDHSAEGSRGDARFGGGSAPRSPRGQDPLRLQLDPVRGGDVLGSGTSPAPAP